MSSESDRPQSPQAIYSTTLFLKPEDMFFPLYLNLTFSHYSFRLVCLSLTPHREQTVPFIFTMTFYVFEDLENSPFKLLYTKQPQYFQLLFMGMFLRPLTIFVAPICGLSDFSMSSL